MTSSKITTPIEAHHQWISHVNKDNVEGLLSVYDEIAVLTPLFPIIYSKGDKH